MSSPVRVLVADDSPIAVAALREALSRVPTVRLAGVARNGAQAVALTAELRPDVVVMDLRMPVMDGLEAVSQIMASTPTPVLAVTSDPGAEEGALAFDALSRGAVDFMARPAGWPLGEGDAEGLAERLCVLATIPVVRHVGRRGVTPPPAPSRRVAPRAVGLVASTGGPVALRTVLEGLPQDYPAPLLVVQHTSRGFARPLASWLDRATPLAVGVARSGVELRAGTAWVAPCDRHLVVQRGGRLALRDAAPVDGHRPSGTVLLTSMAEALGSAAAGVVLTGMGRDGAAGLARIRAAGGATIAQDEATSAIYGMPRAAAELDAAATIAPLRSIATVLMRLAATGAR